MQGTHYNMATLSEPAVELKLARHCLGESKVQHLLRMYGTDLILELEHADTTITTTLNRIAAGITQFSRQQAAMGVRIGGLGLRHLKDLALPAELAAKLTARPHIAELSAALTTARLASGDQVLKHLGTELRNLRTDFEGQLDQTERQQRP